MYICCVNARFTEFFSTSSAPCGLTPTEHFFEKKMSCVRFGSVVANASMPESMRCPESAANALSGANSFVSLAYPMVSAEQSEVERVCGKVNMSFVFEKCE